MINTLSVDIKCSLFLGVIAFYFRKARKEIQELMVLMDKRESLEWMVWLVHQVQGEDKARGDSQGLLGQMENLYVSNLTPAFFMLADFIVQMSPFDLHIASLFNSGSKLFRRIYSASLCRCVEKWVPVITIDLLMIVLYMFPIVHDPCQLFICLGNLELCTAYCLHPRICARVSMCHWSRFGITMGEFSQNWSHLNSIKGES